MGDIGEVEEIIELPAPVTWPVEEEPEKEPVPKKEEPQEEPAYD